MMVQLYSKAAFQQFDAMSRSRSKRAAKVEQFLPGVPEERELLHFAILAGSGFGLATLLNCLFGFFSLRLRWNARLIIFG